jgi:hypothetical protein
VWDVARFGHLRAQAGDHPCVDTTPTGVGDTCCPVGVEDHTETVGGEYSKWETRQCGPESVRLTCITGAVDPHHIATMNLTHGGPLLIDPDLA